ncbi:hypothetical protein [Burkholderia sp. LMU1-1-1.1]|jgi:hypothetical protein|uniref:hypothetical protein n=1 Tax=Burkholderia sp. LMU1-1-1.1 TaxID=3135266 RepID=UPI0034405F1F
MATIKDKASDIIDRFTSDPALKSLIQTELSRKQGTEATVKAIVGLFGLDDDTRDKYVESILKSIGGTPVFHVANYHHDDPDTAARAAENMSHHIVSVKAILAS